MKKIILLIAIGAFFLSSESKAQHFVASFGVHHQWNVPQRIFHAVDYHYYDYDWVHARRIVRGGRVSFDVILQRGDVFVELNVGARGRIFGRTFFDYYPLYEHVCGNYCGFHQAYYRSHRVACNSHIHRGHNHVVYRPIYRQYNKRHYYNNGHNHRSNIHDQRRNQTVRNRSNNSHHKYNSSRYPERRGRYYDSQEARKSKQRRGRAIQYERDDDDDDRRSHRHRSRGSRYSDDD
ncbi:hypothetical protein E1176_10070 [Fulvivirga sp. RKSG066]|uniref:hypothetical protein n=1 Tax=Fulvivirga aurantia TaxID=2529383 RepID=UPI0012BC2B6D|nr:hypothetical protein [Fulvivirga aurantia]MTI21365.1 hypothetical protein [Fulvivirga aurantia]